VLQVVLERDSSAKVRRAAMDAWLAAACVGDACDAAAFQCLLDRARDRCGGAGALVSTPRALTPGVLRRDTRIRGKALALLAAMPARRLAEAFNSQGARPLLAKQFITPTAHCALILTE